MTPEERQMLGELFQRVQSIQSTPRDAQAEAFINDAVKALPFAPYVLAQTVLVQQQALDAAAKHVADLEAQVRQAAPAPAQEGGFLGNLGRSLFGGAPAAPPPQAPRPSGYDASAYQRSAPPPQQGYAPQEGYAPQQGYAQQQPAYAPPPQYAPAPPQAGPWGAAPPAAGGGFMSGALHTAAGVAGGVLLGNALGGLMGGHGGGLFGGGGLGGLGGAGLGGLGGERETINNFYEAPGGSEHHTQDAAYDDASYSNDDQSSSGDDDFSSDDSGFGGDSDV